MEVSKLSDDELQYELKVRGIVGVTDSDEMKTLLRGFLKSEMGHPFENSVCLDANEEISQCVRKIGELQTYIASIEGNRMHDSYRKADAKLYHLLGRVDRISSNDEKLQKKRSVLLKTILHLMREMETNANKFDPSKIKVDCDNSSFTSGTISLTKNMSNTSPNSSFSSREESGTEIFVHHGVALKDHKLKRSERYGDTLPTGTLSIVQYKTGKWLEWKQNDLSFVSDNTDNAEPEWDVVDPVRRRTCSTSSNTEHGATHPIIRMAIADLKSYKIKHHRRQISLMFRNDQLYSFLFQCGNADTFIQALRAFLNTRRVHEKGTYLVINEKEESQSLNKSFAELNLFPDQSSKYVWNFVRNLHNRPYETTMETFSKLSDVLLYRVPENRPMDDDVVELLTKSFHPEFDGHIEAGYTIIDEIKNIKFPPRPPIVRGAPLSFQQWTSMLDINGRVTDPEYIKSAVFKGGIEENLRPEVWKYLLDYYPWNFSTEECRQLRIEKTDEYHKMKSQWESITPGQEQRFSGFRDRKSLIEKDVNRTDRTLSYYAGENNANLQILHNILMTYVMYNFDLGYVQGMSDLLSPILSLTNNEIDAFWCFVGFMNRVSSNFNMDQAGIKLQLSNLYSLLSVVTPELALYLDKHDSSNMFFCFRWLLVWLKREFSHSEIMTLWEVLWTGLPCPNFHLLICVAILDKEKTELMKDGNEFAEILKYVNELSQRINLTQTITAAEGIYMQLKCVGDEVPIGVRRIIGLAPPQENNSESSDEDSYAATTYSNAPTICVRNDSISSSGDAAADKSDANTNNVVEIGFEAVERAMGMNYF